MVVGWRYMAATVVMALAQERGGTPKIDVAPKQRHETVRDGGQTYSPRRAQSFAQESISAMVGPRRWKATMVSWKWRR